MPWCGVCGQGFNMPDGPRCGCGKMTLAEKMRNQPHGWGLTLLTKIEALEKRVAELEREVGRSATGGPMHIEDLGPV